ncbi:MAG: hypothetical protein PVG08_21775 [Desulfobacterales bacterium]|jgi:hypothetical protein
MKLSSNQRRYLLFGYCLIPFVINFLLNGIIGLVTFRGINPVPTWGMVSSAGPDLIGTCFFLPAITCLIVTPLVRRHIRRGAVERTSGSECLPSWLRPFQRPLAARAVLFGLAGLGLIGSLATAALLAAAPTQFGLTPFVWLKASFSAVLGGAVTPIIGLVALAETEPKRQTA